ncbi:hypothetical protein [Caloramator sp. Dgby_cultured_2]|uniref:hypothetical protein n=1 Tax=Caloramator sp. Dgby_cultured_2 TaxID=3029174 RepID=UPI00237D56EC|nr:hypothetical protein [Caloramator sp. Dgby_cultured_2]WDU82494.1 hypothetical protein PWK10_12835 [Caloramator sp. Dgby_cultured_2]
MELDKYFKDGVRYHLISSDDDNVVDIIALYFDWALRNNKKCIFYRHNQNINELEFFWSSADIILILLLKVEGLLLILLMIILLTKRFTLIPTF